MSMKGVTIIACSVFQREVELLWREQWPGYELKFVSSTMHLHPERLTAALQTVVTDERARGRRVVLLFGDCCPRMAGFEALPGVARSRAKNCCELLLGSDDYRRLSREGAFFVIPKWARRWKRFFRGLGLGRDNAASMMQELHSRLVYLDTGLVPAPERELGECAGYCGLPYEVRTVPLDALHGTVEEALARL
jgi:hypothetical protein